MKRIMLVMAVVCCMLGLGSSAAYAKYTWVISSDTIGYYVDYDSKTYFNGHLFYWEKLKYEDDKVRQDYINYLNVLTGKDCSQLYYSIEKMESYYSTGSLYRRNVYTLFYDYDGNLLYSLDYKFNWNITPPESFGKIVDDRVRAYKK